MENENTMQMGRFSVTGHIDDLGLLHLTVTSKRGQVGFLMNLVTLYDHESIMTDDVRLLEMEGHDTEKALLDTQSALYAEVDRDPEFGRIIRALRWYRWDEAGYQAWKDGKSEEEICMVVRAAIKSDKNVAAK